MLTLKLLNEIDKTKKNEDKEKLYIDHGKDLVLEAKRSLRFDGILGALKTVLETPCHSYGGEEPGNQCCFRFGMGQTNPCISCQTRKTTGYPCLACNKSHRNE